MTSWTNHEVTRLIEMHRVGYPTAQQMYDAFPKHTIGSISVRASKLHLRKSLAAQWLIRAHLYFEFREAEIKQFRDKQACRVSISTKAASTLSFLRRIRRCGSG